MPRMEEIRRFFGKALDPDAEPGGGSAAPPDKGTATTAGSQPGAAAPSGERDTESFVRKLRAAVAEDSLPVAATVQMLTLDGLKDHFGDRWERLSDRIHSVIRGTIERNQTERDIYTCFGNKVYVLLFTGIDEDGATLKTALIAEEISRRLFGDMPDKSLMRVGVAKIDGGDIGESELHDPREIVKSVFRKTTRAGNVINLQPRDPGAIADDDGGGEASSGRPAEPGRRREDWQWEADGREAVADGVLSPERGAAAAGGRGRLAPREAVAGDPLPQWLPLDVELENIPKNLRFIYSPAWLVKREMIAAQTCVPARILRDGTIVQGGGAMPAKRAAPVNFSLDILALRKVAGDLGQQARAGVTCVVVLPVHIQTLGHVRFRDPFLAALKVVPESLRAQIMVEVMGVTEETPSSTLAEVVARLSPLCRRLLIRTRLEAQTLEHLCFPEVQAVGVDLSTLPFGEREIFRGMESFNALARRYGKRTFVHGLRTRSLLSAAAAAGFWYLDGGIVSAAVLDPGPARPWSIADVYVSLF